VGLQARGLLGHDLALEATAGGTVLIGAGLFQLSPLKGACLTHCRNPLSYFLRSWRDGPVGAFRMGAAHGVFCVGCCWALMAVALALGVMNLLWMAALTGMLILEKNAPGGRQMGILFGWVLIVWGGFLVV
jgi:predicted metal-binding membrane protein